MRFWNLSRHYNTLTAVFSQSLLQRLGIRRQWYEINGWFNWRSAQEEAVSRFPDGSRFVEVGTYLGRSLCSCRGSGPEGWRGKDSHADAVQQVGGTFAGALHKNVLDCGLVE
jgi:hypothetical protein